MVKVRQILVYMVKVRQESGLFYYCMGKTGYNHDKRWAGIWYSIMAWGRQYIAFYLYVKIHQCECT